MLSDGFGFDADTHVVIFKTSETFTGLRMKAVSYNRPSGGSGDVPFQPQNYLIPKQSTKGEDKGVFELMSLLPLLEVGRQMYF